MSLTAHQLVLQLAQYQGVVSLDPADSTNTGPLRSGISPLLLPTALAHINGALQEIHKVSPTGAYYRRVRTTLNGPTPVTLTLANGSASVTVTSGWKDWMVGCSVVFGGDQVANDFVNATTLREAWNGTSGSYSATVYHDCIILASDVLNVRQPVEMPQTWLLRAASSREEFYTYDWNRIYGTDYGRGLSRNAASPLIPAQPRAYYTEREQIGSGSQVRLQFRPVPDTSYHLSYGVISNAISISESDILASSSDYTTDPWVPTEANPAGYSFGIPGDWDESVLLPMALKRFSATPGFGNGNALAAAEIDRQYKVAKGILQSSAPNRAPAKIACHFR